MGNRHSRPVEPSVPNTSVAPAGAPLSRDEVVLHGIRQFCTVLLEHPELLQGASQQQPSISRPQVCAAQGLILQLQVLLFEFLIFGEGMWPSYPAATISSKVIPC